MSVYAAYGVTIHHDDYDGAAWTRSGDDDDRRDGGYDDGQSG
jgi:hypothetical protein